MAILVKWEKCKIKWMPNYLRCQFVTFFWHQLNGFTVVSGHAQCFNKKSPNYFWSLIQPKRQEIGGVTSITHIYSDSFLFHIAAIKFGSFKFCCHNFFSYMKGLHCCIWPQIFAGHLFLQFGLPEKLNGFTVFEQ